jgi:hypothetical protein
MKKFYGHYKFDDTYAMMNKPNVKLFSLGLIIRQPIAGKLLMRVSPDDSKTRI